jgi:hypothetical protein
MRHRCSDEDGTPNNRIDTIEMETAGICSRSVRETNVSLCEYICAVLGEWTVFQYKSRPAVQLCIVRGGRESRLHNTSVASHSVLVQMYWNTIFVTLECLPCSILRALMQFIFRSIFIFRLTASGKTVFVTVPYDGGDRWMCEHECFSLYNKSGKAAFKFGQNIAYLLNVLLVFCEYHWSVCSFAANRPINVFLKIC